MDDDSRRLRLQQWFPSLTSGNFDLTSDVDVYYNCIAWAAEDNQNWWEPDPGCGYYWPPGVSRTYTLASYTAAFESLGYQVCSSLQFEGGYQKVALYTNAMGHPTYAARQLPDGRWTSKIGQADDISHASLDALQGTRYGDVAVILRRPIIS